MMALLCTPVLGNSTAEFGDRFELFLGARLR